MPLSWPERERHAWTAGLVSWCSLCRSQAAELQAMWTNHEVNYPSHLAVIIQNFVSNIWLILSRQCNEYSEVIIFTLFPNFITFIDLRKHREIVIPWPCWSGAIKNENGYRENISMFEAISFACVYSYFWWVPRKACIFRPRHTCRNLFKYWCHVIWKWLCIFCERTSRQYPLVNVAGMPVVLKLLISGYLLL